MVASTVALTAAHGQSITGAGSTFAAPIYSKWGEAAHTATGISLNYQAIGSGAGLNQIINRTVDFGASDAPVPAEKLASGHLLQFPTVMGGVVVIVNLPGVEINQLKLTGESPSGMTRSWLSSIVALPCQIWRSHRFIGRMGPAQPMYLPTICPC
jgi:phosphate transport system substrate-binding protein